MPKSILAINRVNVNTAARPTPTPRTTILPASFKVGANLLVEIDVRAAR
jgi:hypothetical protein